MDRQYSGLTKMGFAVLACNSALAIYSSGGDPGTVAFVLVADAVLALLFLGLRVLERADRGSDRTGGIAGRYSVLANMGLAALGCDAALAVHDAAGAGAAGSTLACVLLAYAALLALTWIFLRSFGGRAHGESRR